MGLLAVVREHLREQRNELFFSSLRKNNGVGSHSFPYELDAIVTNPLFIRK
jgi:hypothetical protein